MLGIAGLSLIVVGLVLVTNGHAIYGIVALILAFAVFFLASDRSRRRSGRRWGTDGGDSDGDGGSWDGGGSDGGGGGDGGGGD